MAISQHYVDWATGNDYTGASFTDGAFTVADMTLTKAGAFAASQLNHWLYLDDNGSGEVTPGYYRITNIGGVPNSVVLHADIRSGVNDPTDVVCTQAAGTALLPWRSLQGAFDLLTRNTTDGNQVNLKAGTAQVNAAALNLAVFVAAGALAVAAPLVIRGYTSSADDGGIGEIDCGEVTMWGATAANWVKLVDLEIHSFGNANGISLGTGGIAFRCEVHKGASTPSGKILLNSPNIVGCYVHDAGTNGYGITVNGGLGAYNYIADCPTLGIGLSGTALHNVIKCSAAWAMGISNSTSGPNFIIGNIVYNSEAGMSNGIRVGPVAGRVGYVLNNIIEGFSGVGGTGISASVAVGEMHGWNAFYNNTTNVSYADGLYLDFSASDVLLAASPFTDPANGDFSLTAAAQAALADKGFPAQYLGAHANTDSHLNIGPIQLSAVTPDYPAEGDVESGVSYGSGAYTGDFVVPAEADVKSGTTYGSAAEFTGTMAATRKGGGLSGLTGI